MSRGFVFASPSEMIIDSVAVVGSKALSVKAPWLCLHRAHHRYSGKRGCRIIHDRSGHPSNARSNQNKAEHLGVTGLRAVLINPPIPRHRLKGSCTVEPLCIFRISILALEFAFHKKNTHVFACGINRMFCLNLAGHVGGFGTRLTIFFRVRRSDIFSITVISLWNKLWNHILLSFINMMKLTKYGLGL